MALAETVERHEIPDMIEFSGVDAPGPDDPVRMFTKGPGVTGKAAKGFMLGEAPAPTG